MKFEDWQKAWQSQNAGASVTINADVLLQEVRRNQQHFLATIFWRDVREVGVAYLLAVFFIAYGGRRDWTHLLVGLACFGVGTFILADRRRQRRRQPAPNDSLRVCAEDSLNQVKHQIWLLRNVFWWYLLPIGAPLAGSTVAAIWHNRHGANELADRCFYGLFCVLLFWGIYWLNQFAVRKTLAPRQRELEALLAQTEIPRAPSEPSIQP
jgi:hypothetical protein